MSRRAGRPLKPRIDQVAPRGWLSIRVELVEGRGENYWPRPGRLIAAAPIHSFAQLATTIDSAFARWDISHIHQFELSDDTKLGRPDVQIPNLRIYLRSNRVGGPRPIDD